MTLFFVTFGVIVFLVLIMAIGVMFGRKPIMGSCGGYEALNVDCAAGCKNPCLKRRIANARARFSR
ncbi:MAG: (Na+)-NQR maturation NqrM [Betaproteobacteria bacterium]|nr:(Na+)-NQR maturation NqrM [Betaproteobacteria bacterium]